jgi:uncharacterized protein (TIGR00725 family)
MEAALVGARRAGGLTIGILPHDTELAASEAADIRIVTGLGEARNVVNVLSSRVVFVCGMGPGTASETALALKTRRHTILVAPPRATADFWTSLDRSWLHLAATPDEAVELAARLVESSSPP